jgi:hypothetical protein
MTLALYQTKGDIPKAQQAFEKLFEPAVHARREQSGRSTGARR